MLTPCKARKEVR